MVFPMWALKIFSMSPVMTNRFTTNLVSFGETSVGGSYLLTLKTSRGCPSVSGVLCLRLPAELRHQDAFGTIGDMWRPRKPFIGLTGEPVGPGGPLAPDSP